MAVRLAAACSLVAFALCLLVGVLEADNPFTTAVLRALVAMGVTLVVGLVVGSMAEAMLRENVEAAEKKLKKQTAEQSAEGR